MKLELEAVKPSLLPLLALPEARRASSAGLQILLGLMAPRQGRAGGGRVGGSAGSSGQGKRKGAAAGGATATLTYLGNVGHGGPSLQRGTPLRVLMS